MSNFKVGTKDFDLEDRYLTDTFILDRFIGNQLWVWGYNHAGQVGNATTTNRSSPTQIGFNTNWEEVEVGAYHVLSIKTDGTLWSWGFGGNGQLGGAASINRSSPQQVGSFTNWDSIAGIGNTSAGIRSGALWIWGQNTYGQLGLSLASSVSVSSPQQIGTATNWKNVFGSPGNVMGALKTDNTLWAWGRNDFYQLGIGSATTVDHRSSPVQIGTATDWKLAAFGTNHAVAIKKDGSLWAWGRNNYGQIGSGNSNINYSGPVQIGTSLNWTNVSAGTTHTIAIKDNGTLWAWGRNNYGQIGVNNTTNYSSPIQIGAGTDWKSAQAGFIGSVGLKTNGTMWSWGHGSYGLGGGVSVHRSSPLQVSGTTAWKQISNGGYTIAATTFADATTITNY